MTYKHQEYPKWVKTVDNNEIIVHTKEEEESHTSKKIATKNKDEKNESTDKNNSKRADKKIS